MSASRRRRHLLAFASKNWRRSTRRREFHSIRPKSFWGVLFPPKSSVHRRSGRCHPTSSIVDRLLPSRRGGFFRPRFAALGGFEWLLIGLEILLLSSVLFIDRPKRSSPRDSPVSNKIVSFNNLVSCNIVVVVVVGYPVEPKSTGFHSILPSFLTKILSKFSNNRSAVF